MGEKTGISWTDATWTVVTGCSKVSPGCAHCYAETLSLRHGWTKEPWEPANVEQNVVCHEERLNWPNKWREPKKVFISSMGDLFHEQVPFEFVARVWRVMYIETRHTFQVLTKRPERVLEFYEWWSHNWKALNAFDFALPNVWLGVSVENQHWADERIPLLLQTPAAIRFISAEPLLEDLQLECLPYTPPVVEGFPGTYNALEGMWTLAVGNPDEEARNRFEGPKIDWIIAGGESGPHARPMDEQWVRHLRDQCGWNETAFFFKQWGGARPGGTALLDGVEHHAFPVAVLPERR